MGGFYIITVCVKCCNPKAVVCSSFANYQNPTKVNKNGTIILLDTDNIAGDVLCDGIKALGHKNDIMCFDDSEAVGNYLVRNQSEVFLLLQNSASPGVEIPDTRNMVFMHESFKTDSIPYTFLVLTKERLQNGRLHTFVHCYYRMSDERELIDTLATVIAFWKDHVFPPRVVRQH